MLSFQPISAEHLTIVRVEITASESSIRHGLWPSFAALNQEIRRRDPIVAQDPGRGYDKTWFTLTFSDGQTYEGRYDIGCDTGDLVSHIRSHVKWVKKAFHFDPAKVESFEYFEQTYLPVIEAASRVKVDPAAGVLFPHV